jgi:hypothetical protein
MNLVEVHVVGLQAAETLIEFIQDGFPRETAAVGLVAHCTVDFSGDNNGVATDVGF